jgi:hypothetical protein
MCRSLDHRSDLVPPVVVALAKHPAVRSGKYDLSSVESVGCGAAPLGGRSAKRWRICGKRERSI